MANAPSLTKFDQISITSSAISPATTCKVQRQFADFTWHGLFHEGLICYCTSF